MDLIVEFFRRLFFVTPKPPPEFSPFDYHNEVGMMFYSAMLGAIVGAIVGGIVQAILSKIEYNRHQADEAAERLETKKAQARRSVGKAIRIANGLSNLVREFHQTIDDNKGDLPEHLVLWQRLLPLSGLPLDIPTIDIDDIAMLLEAKEDHIANQLILLSDRYAADLGAVKDFTRMKEALGETLPPQVFLGTVGSIVLGKEIFFPYMPKIISLSNLSDGMCISLAEDLELAVNILEVLGPAFQKILGTSNYYDVSFAGESKTRAKAFRQLISNFIRPGDFGLQYSN